MHLRGFTEDMKHLGMVPSSKPCWRQTVVKATEELAEKLKVEPEEVVMRLRRLRLADGTPMALEESHIPLRQFPGLDKISFAKQSLYFVLRESYGVRVAWADEVIEALPATREESELLTIPKRAKHPVDLAHHHDDRRDTDRGRLFTLPWRPLQGFDPRPHHHY